MVRITLITLFTLVFWNGLFSQTRSDLVGTWKIVKVELSPEAPPEMKQGLGMLSEMLVNSLLQFKENNGFSMDSPIPDLSAKDGVWQYDAQKKTIKVTERISDGTKGVLMEITVRVKNGTYLFSMAETPVILTVTKKG